MGLALIVTAKKLRPYFQTHSIIVPADTQLRQVLSKLEVYDRLQKWSVELNKFDIEYVPRIAIKGQVLVDFSTEIPTK